MDRRRRGGTSDPSGLDRFRRVGAGFTVSGSGDIAPVEPQVAGGIRIEYPISVGSFAALIAVAVLGALFITAEYRRGLIRLTLAASPRRGRVLAAKAIVIGAVTLAAGIAGIAIALPVGLAKLRPRPAAHPLAGTRRARRLGSRSAAGRRPGAPAPRCVTAGAASTPAIGRPQRATACGACAASGTWEAGGST